MIDMLAQAAKPTPKAKEEIIDWSKVKTPLEKLGFGHKEQLVFKNANSKGIISNHKEIIKYLEVQIKTSILDTSELDLYEIQKREKFRDNMNLIIEKVKGLSDFEKEIFDDELASFYKHTQIKTEEVEENNKDNEIIEANQFRTEVFNLLLQKKRSEVSELIVQEFYKNNHIKVSRDDNNPEFKIYKNGIYVNEGKTYIEEFTREILMDNYSTQILNDILNKISADNKCDFEKLNSERDPYLLATKDCLINLKTFESQPFSPDIVLFNKIPVKYDKEKKCPKILNFLDEILETKEDSKLIQEIIGMGLVNDYFMEKAIMFLGSGRNGKGKLLQLMKNFYGVENTCSVRLQEMNTQSSSIWELENRFVNLAGDLSNTSLKDTGLFKETTGRDPIQAKRKYKNDLKFTNSANHIFACNELPRVYDNSDGFWERWVLINFPYKFIEKKDFDKLSEGERKNKKIMNKNVIRDILSDEELSGLLNLAITGLQRLNQNSAFSYSQNAEEIKNSWVRQSDSFQAFAMDNLEYDYDGQISKVYLRKEYFKYCKKFRARPSSDKSIKFTLETSFGCIENRPISSEGWVWEGVKFKKSKVCKGIPESPVKKIYKGSRDTIAKVALDTKSSDLMTFFNENKERLVHFDEIVRIIKETKKEDLHNLKEEGKIDEVKPNQYQLI